MYHEKITAHEEVPLDFDGRGPLPRHGVAAKAKAALVVCALPLILPYLLVHLLWRDVRKFGRGLRAAYVISLEELSRTS